MVMTSRVAGIVFIVIGVLAMWIMIGTMPDDYEISKTYEYELSYDGAEHIDLIKTERVVGAMTVLLINSAIGILFLMLSSILDRLNIISGLKEIKEAQQE